MLLSDSNFQDKPPEDLVKDLSFGQLQLLLQEAASYKHPQDRQNKSKLFQVSTQIFCTQVITRTHFWASGKVLDSLQLRRKTVSSPALVWFDLPDPILSASKRSDQNSCLGVLNYLGNSVLPSRVQNNSTYASLECIFLAYFAVELFSLFWWAHSGVWSDLVIYYVETVLSAVVGRIFKIK